MSRRGKANNMTCDSWPWYVPETDAAAVGRLCDALGIHRLTAVSLLRLGLSEPAEARRFISSGIDDLADPRLMSGAEQAACRLADGAMRGETILVYGDYDVDGITSTALMTLALQKMGASVQYYIPSRLGDGYGLHGAVLEQFARDGGKLALTVDCGINSFTEMELARSLGLDLVITDHHECFPGERPAFAVLNPKQAGCTYPERNLAGVGVAYTLVRELYRRRGLPASGHTAFLDLVAVGTVADVVPLLGENRILVRLGLERMCSTPRPGLAALARVSGMQGLGLSAAQVAFTLAPRLNAPGRMGDAVPALQLLLAGEAEAETLALSLDAQNRQRQQLEKGIAEEAREMAAKELNEPALVLWKDGWHPGVLGIVAGRLASEFGRPVLLIAIDGEEGNGSARTSPGYNLVEALQCCAQDLVRFGGHQEAAGLTVHVSKLTDFRRRFLDCINSQPAPEKKKAVTAEAGLDELTLALVNELSQLQPFGHGNPEPVFLARGAFLESTRRVGTAGTHLQLQLRRRVQVRGIFFGGAETPVHKGDTVDTVFTLQENSWQGRTSLSLIVQDIRKAQSAGSFVIDKRKEMGRDAYLARLAEEMRLLVWVNTKAAAENLRRLLPAGRARITQLGRDFRQADCDVLVLYHLPYDRKALERLLAQVQSVSRLCLCYGPEDLQLNETVFAASIPTVESLRYVAACLEEHGNVSQDILKSFPFPATRHLLEQSLRVIEELRGQGETEREPDYSDTFCEGSRCLQAFRAYQSFWLEADEGTIAKYLQNPGGLILPEGDRNDESARIKRAY